MGSRKEKPLAELLQRPGIATMSPKPVERESRRITCGTGERRKKGRCPEGNQGVLTKKTKIRCKEASECSKAETDREKQIKRGRFIHRNPGDPHTPPHGWQFFCPVCLGLFCCKECKGQHEVWGSRCQKQRRLGWHVPDAAAAGSGPSVSLPRPDDQLDEREGGPGSRSRPEVGGADLDMEQQLGHASAPAGRRREEGHPADVQRSPSLNDAGRAAPAFGADAPAPKLCPGGGCDTAEPLLPSGTEKKRKHRGWTLEEVRARFVGALEALDSLDPPAASAAGLDEATVVEVKDCLWKHGLLHSTPLAHGAPPVPSRLEGRSYPGLQNGESAGLAEPEGQGGRVPEPQLASDAPQRNSIQPPESFESLTRSIVEGIVFKKNVQAT